jgi:hypothetical protein
VTSASSRKAEFEALLARFAEVRVAFVGHERLVVPAPVVPVQGDVQVLSYGLDMPVPIPDLTVTDAGISATLSFSRESHATFVPWESVVGILGFGESSKSVVKSSRPKLTLVP